MASGDKDVGLSIGVEDVGLEAGLQKAKTTVKEASAQMQASMQGVSNAFKTVQTAFLGFTAVIAGGAAFKSMINASNEWAGQQNQLSKALGISTEKASVLSVAMNHLGIDSGTMISASQKISKQIFSNSDAFETMGVKVKDSAGNYRPVTDVMGEVNAKLLAIKNPIEQNIAGMQMYGKGWAEIKPVLKLTQEEMKKAEQRARELGLIVGPDGVARAKQYKEQMADLNLVSKSLEVQFGNALLPVFVRTGQFMSEEGPAAGKAFGTCIEAIGFAASSTWLALKDMGDGIGALAAQSAALLSGDIAGFKAIGKARDEEAAKNEAAYERLKAGFGKDLPKSASSATVPPKDDGSHYNFKPGREKKEKSHKDKKDPSEMKEYELELEKLKLAYAEQNEGRELDKATELTFWNTKLQTVKKGSDDETAILKKAAQVKLQMLVEAHRQEDALNKQVIDDAERDALSQLAIQEELAKGELEAGRITKSQLLQQQIAFEKQRLAIELEAEEERKSLLNTKTDQVGISASDSKMADKRRQANLKLVQLDMQLKAQESPIWSAMSNSMSSLWDKGISAMMSGTLRWKNALRATWTEMAGMFAKSVIKPIVANWAKSLSTMIAQKLGFAATEKAIDTTSAATSMATTGAAATVKVGANAASAASGAASALASIPYVGPILAIAAMGAMFAAVTAMGSNVKSASGGYDIPSGLNPVTQLHEEEMVLPKGIANPMRKMLAGGGLGGGQQEVTPVQAGDVHYHDYSGKLTKSQIRENAAVIATELNRLHRDGWRPK